MALIKLNDRGVKDATAFGSISSLGVQMVEVIIMLLKLQLIF